MCKIALLDFVHCLNNKITPVQKLDSTSLSSGRNGARRQRTYLGLLVELASDLSSSTRWPNRWAFRLLFPFFYLNTRAESSFQKLAIL
jgi:hypothetical protein